MERVADEDTQRQRGRRRRRRRETRHEQKQSSNTRESQLCSSASNRILRALEPLSWLRWSERALLHHFVAEASCVVIASRHGQRIFCETIVPLALQSPSLLYATLAYSATQRQSLRPSSHSTPDPSISRYVSSSLSAVQTELLQPGPGKKASLLAASLMLCLVSVSSGDVHSRSWRVHAEGAKALLASVQRVDLGSAGPDLLAMIRFLSRWYLSIESLTSLTSTGLVTGQCVVRDSTLGTITEPLQPTLDVCDDHFAYPTRLALLFREIGATAWERRRRLVAGQHWPQLSQEDFDLDADSLHESLEQISAGVMHPAHGLEFYPGVRETLSDQNLRDFAACSEAWICMARILIERRVRGTPSGSESVQAPVRAIIRALQVITLSSEPSPATAIGPPLFTAGCEAITQSDRQAIRDTFARFGGHSKSLNMERGLGILETLWEKDGTVPDWLEYQEARSWDFLPY